MTLFTIQNQIAVKLLALLTILMMVASLVPASVFAQSVVEDTELIIDGVPSGDQEQDGSDVTNLEFDIDGETTDEEVEVPLEDYENTNARFIQIPKVTICHATDNETNPFEQIEIALPAIIGHLRHGDDIFPSYGSYEGRNQETVYEQWGDVTGQEIFDNDCAIPEPEKESETIVVTGDTAVWKFNADLTTATPFAFNTSESSIGVGSLEVFPIGTNPADKMVAANILQIPVTDLLSVSYDFLIAGDGVEADENQFYLNIYANIDNSNNYYDCRFDYIPNNGIDGSFATASFDSTDTPVNVTKRGSRIANCPATLAEMPAGSYVNFIALNVGDTSASDSGLGGNYDKVVVDTVTKITTYDFEPASKEDEVTIVATKLVCTDEADLPNWGNGGQGPITEDTAANWLEEHESCDFASDWEFQYADQNGPDTAGDLVGEAEGYTTFKNPTDENGVTTESILLGKGVTELHLREVLQDGYIPFSKNNEDDVSAEFYCANDVLNYDNWDFIRNPEAGETYYCVAFNVPTEIPQEPVCEIGKNLLQNGSFENTPAVTANGGQWQIFAAISDWIVGLSDGIEVWNTFNGVSNDVASEGLQNVELDGNDATRLTQSVTTIPGATYELKFDFSPRATIGAADNVMAVLVDGATIDTVNGNGTGTTTNSWTPQSQTFVAASTSTTVGFEDIGTANDNGGYGPLLDNVALCLVREPEPLPTCSLTIKSDATDYVVEKNALAQVLSTINGAWVAAIGTSTAAWIWGDNPVVNPTVAETQTFKKGFTWTGGTPTSATLKVASDNSHAVTLGSFSGGNLGEFNYGAVTSYNVASGIVAGANTLEIAVKNFPVSLSTAESNPAGLIYELTITGTGESCGTVVPEVPKTTGTVTMCKVDEEKNPLAGWTMTLLGDTVDSVVVPAGNAAGVNTTVSLDAGKSYVAVAQGTWNNNRGPLNIVDAEYSTEDNWVTQMDGFTGYPTDILELSINNVLDPQSQWGSYNGDHTYAQMFTQAATGTAKFHIADTFYGDNTGELNVTVFEGYAGITGENGCVTFNNVPFGTYDADEVLKAGWEQVEGAGDISVTYSNQAPRVTIVNEREDSDDGDDTDPETYRLDGYKYACTENYASRSSNYDNDGEYYNCDTEDTVSGWTIYAQNGDDEPISTTTDENGYYYFDVEEGDWTVSEDTEDSDWEQVYVAQGGEELDDATVCEFEVENETLLDRVQKYIYGDDYGPYQCDFWNYYDGKDTTPRTYTVTGVKWNDVDGDGVKDTEEGKLANWLITATQGSTSVATTTNANGDYTLVLPYDEGVWVISETLQSGWTQTGLYKNGTKVTLGGEVSNNCSFELGVSVPSATCDFGNQQNPVVVDEPETPRRSGGGGSGTRVTNRVTPTGLVLGAATGTPACGMYLNDYMRMGNAASTTQVTKLQVFLNAVGITTPLTGMFDASTDAAVRAFQAQHKAEVLTPWYLAKIVPHENPTGWVYQLTRWKINNIVCPGSEAYPVLN